MLIVGSNLEQLILQHRVVAPGNVYDVNSLNLTLDKQIVLLRPPSGKTELVYGQAIPDDWIHREEIGDDGLVLESGAAILGCSREQLRMPLGHFGLLQTKGSLARLFVQVSCADGQIEAGFTGRVTFEVCNLAPFAVRLFAKQKVAQVFIIRTSTKQTTKYCGRYQNANGPTIQLPED